MKTSSVKYFYYLYTVLLLLFSTTFHSCDREVSIIKFDESIHNGFIYVNSIPSGAAIYQDGKNTGRFTPDSLRYLASGTYQLTLKLKYFRDTVFSVQLKDPDFKAYMIDYYTNPLMFGSINFTSDPTGAKIFINDSSIQTITPFSMKNVKPGQYNIRYEKENHRHLDFNLIVESNKNSTAYAKLRDTSAWLDYQVSNSGLSSNLLTCISIDNTNIIWMGTFDRGLIKYDRTAFTSYSTSNSPVPGNNINCISVDHNNNKWIGTSSGIAVFNNSSWVIYNKSNSGLNNNNINSIQFENNVAWIGTPVGLVRFDGNNWTTYDTITANPQPEFAAVNDLAIDNLGYKWLATANSGIFKFKDGIFGRSFRDTIPGIPSNRIISAAISLNGDKWFGHLPGPGTTGGISIFNNSTWKTILFGSTGNLIADIFVDNLNTKWIATNEGVMKIINDSPTFFYTRLNSLISSNQVRGVAKDNDGVIWIATFGGGLNKFKQ